VSQSMARRQALASDVPPYHDWHKQACAPTATSLRSARLSRGRRRCSRAARCRGRAGVCVDVTASGAVMACTDASCSACQRPEACWIRISRAQCHVAWLRPGDNSHCMCMRRPSAVWWVSGSGVGSDGGRALRSAGGAVRAVPAGVAHALGQASAGGGYGCCALARSCGFYITNLTCCNACSVP